MAERAAEEKGREQKEKGQQNSSVYWGATDLGSLQASSLLDSYNQEDRGSSKAARLIHPNQQPNHTGRQADKGQAVFRNP